MRIHRLFFIAFAGVTRLSNASAIATQEPSLANNLSNSYLKSFAIDVKPPSPPQPEQLALSKKKSKKSKKSPVKIIEVFLSPQEARATVFNEIFAKSALYRHKYAPGPRVFNSYAWSDLHLFYGTTTAPSHHLLSRLNNTITILGEGALASLLAVPTTDLDLLTKRQALLRGFCEEKELVHSIKHLLTHYQTIEKDLLSLWTSTDPLYSEEYHKYLSKLFYTSDPKLNKKARRLQLRKIFRRDIWDIYLEVIWYPVMGALVGETMIIPFVKGLTHEQYYQKEFWYWVPIYNFYNTHKRSKDFPQITNGIRDPQDKFLVNRILNGEKNWKYGISTAITLGSLRNFYLAYRHYKEYAGVLRNLALRMANLQAFLNTAKKINTLVQSNPTVEALYGPQLSGTRALLARISEQSEVGNLLRYLETLPFSSWSYIFDNAGKLLATYKLFDEHKAVLHDAMYELGELDAFLSVASLIEENKQKNIPNTYTFTQFLSPATHKKPYLSLLSMWNPMLEGKTAVGNDLSMDTQTDTQNIILTGPNAGGKSTFLTGLAYAILLSQTFGIAPAQRCTMTPFCKINTYIDITDDIAAGLSFFSSEARRFKEHLNTLEQLKPNEYSFSILDEPFSGTNPREAAAAGYAVLKHIANFQNAFHIVATHYPSIIGLEKDPSVKGFKNYKVFIQPKMAKEKIPYVYKVVPGESDQTIAIDILEELGYASQIIKNARKVLHNPQKYQKTFAKP